MAYKLIKQPSMMMIGIACRTSNAPDKGPIDIPQHWGKFHMENTVEKIPNKTSQEIIGLYCEYDGDHTQPYTLIIGCPVNSFESIPEGMVSKVIPGSTYAVFSAKGTFPQSLIDTWGQIWQAKELKRTYTGDFEVYGQKFASSQEVDVFIAVTETSV